jgi:hypothetical protein
MNGSLEMGIYMWTMSTDHFHPARSRVSDAALADFIRAPIRGDVEEVPGIGRKTMELLWNAGITTTFSLLGKYLMLKEKGVDPVEHADRFYFWLKSLGTPAGYRAGIVHAVAEKLNITFVGIYDASIYDDEIEISVS